MEAKPSAPATAAPAAILFSLIVNSFNQLAALPMPRKAACRMLAKRQGAHDYFLICLSSHSANALATGELQAYLSAAAVAL
jgi:hypothetical protein